jgi:hypothetical protein
VLLKLKMCRGMANSVSCWTDYECRRCPESGPAEYFLLSTIWKHSDIRTTTSTNGFSEDRVKIGTAVSSMG